MVFKSASEISTYTNTPFLVGSCVIYTHRVSIIRAILISVPESIFPELRRRFGLIGFSFLTGEEENFCSGLRFFYCRQIRKRKFRDEDLILDRKIVRCIGSFGLRKIFISAALEFRMKNRRKILQAKVNMKFHNWKLWASDINKHDPLESCHDSWFIDWKSQIFFGEKIFKFCHRLRPQSYFPSSSPFSHFRMCANSEKFDV